MKITFMTALFVERSVELKEESNLSNCLNYSMWFFKDFISIIILAPETSLMTNVLSLMFSISIIISMAMNKFPTKLIRILRNIFWLSKGLLRQKELLSGTNLP